MMLLFATSVLLAGLVPMAPIEGECVRLVPDGQKEVMRLSALADRIRFLEAKRKNEKAGKSKDCWRKSLPLVLSVKATDDEKGPWKVLIGKSPDLSDARVWYRSSAKVDKATGRAEDVVLKAKGTHRMFWLANAQAKLSCVTIQGGNSGATSGGGVYIDAAGGTVERSIVRGCQATGNSIPGGGIYVASGADQGLVDCCVISNCMCHREGDGAGLAIALYGGEARSCLITENVETSKNGSQKTICGVRPPAARTSANASKTARRASG